MGAPSISELRLSRIADIERRTQDVVLARGYTDPVSGTTVSLSIPNLIKYQTFSGLGSLLSSITVENVDPTQPPLVLGILGAVSTFAGNVNAYLRSVYEAESALKSQIRAASTIAQLEAVVDAR